MLPKNYYLFKRGRVWYTKFRDPHTGQIGTPESTGQTNKTRADQWAADEYTKREGVAGSCRTLYREWIARFYAKDCPHCSTLYDRGRTIAESTLKQNRHYIDTILLADPICDIPLGDIRRRDVLEVKERIIIAKGRTRTAQQVFQVFCTSLAEATARDLLDINPVAGVPKIAYKKQPRKAVAFRVVQKILDVEHWDSLDAWRMAFLAAYTGMRAGEVLGLRWQSVDNPPGRITVNNNRPRGSDKDKAPKWGKVRVTVYPARVREVFEPLRQSAGYVFHLDGKPYPYDYLHDALDRACIRAGVRATMHQLRHSLNTYLRGQGVADDLLRGAFGWSGETVQEGYTHRELYDLAPISRALEGL